MMPDREWFVETYRQEHFSDCSRRLSRDAVCDCSTDEENAKFTTNLDALLAAEFVAGVEWALKHTSTRDEWPLSWDAGFPGLKAQALIDRAAIARGGAGT